MVLTIDWVNVWILRKGRRVVIGCSLKLAMNHWHTSKKSYSGGNSHMENASTRASLIGPPTCGSACMYVVCGCMRVRLSAHCMRVGGRNGSFVGSMSVRGCMGVGIVWVCMWCICGGMLVCTGGCAWMGVQMCNTTDFLVCAD